jgi:glycosyltransferase involved in cell wall biosynthesis
MKTSQRKASIGLPVYNGENYLQNALTRLLQQDFEDFEMIICDNASTDGTQEICRAFAQKDRRIRYFRNERNIGLAANHNRTFALAKGEYFKWAAHDDDFPRTMLSRFVQVFDESPESVCLVYSQCEYIDDHGNVQWIDSDGVANNDPWPHRRLAYFHRYVHMYNCPYGLIRSKVLRKTRLHGLFPGSDHVLFAELAMLGIFVEIPEPLLRIRRHPGRTFTANKTPSALRELFNPGQGHKFSPLGLKTRMHLELVRSALLVPTSRRDKVLCTAVALAVPPWESFRAFGGRHKRKLLQIIRQRYAITSLSLSRSPHENDHDREFDD